MTNKFVEISGGRAVMLGCADGAACNGSRSRSVARRRDADRVWGGQVQADVFDPDLNAAAGKLALGRKLLEDGDAAGALAPLTAAASLDAGSAEARYLLACAFHDLERRPDAETALREALALEPDHPQAVHRLGVILSELERWPEALGALRKAAKLQPEKAIVERDLAVALLVMGEVEGARRSYARAVALGQWSHASLYNAVRLTRMDEESPEASGLWRSLQELRARDDLSDDDRIQLHFALGRAHADRGEVEQASAAWAEGARLKRASMRYLVEPTLARWAEVRRIFDRPLLDRLAGAGSPSQVPIFICGLPRSGSTLVEQILAAHPQVEAAGESHALPRVVGTVQTPRGEPWPAWAPSMTGADCRQLADAYLRQIPACGPGKTRVTDKRLENVETLGLIHLTFPNGALIHVRRDLRDVAFSCWTTLFAYAQPFTYDLEEMAAYFLGVEALVAHWRSVVPPGRLLEVAYEDLVADPEAWSRRIVAHCGLTWDDRCLEPHKAARPVTTASDAQVRKPVYGSSVGRWKPYAAALKPFIERIESARN